MIAGLRLSQGLSGLLRHCIGAICTSSAARWVLRAGVLACVWPRRLPIMGEPWREVTAVEAKMWRKSWMRASCTLARARTRRQNGGRSLKRAPGRVSAMTQGFPSMEWASRRSSRAGGSRSTRLAPAPDGPGAARPRADQRLTFWRHFSRMISFSRQSVWTARRATRMTEGSAILFASISRRSAPIRRNSGALRKRSRFSSGYFWMSLRGLVPSWCRPQSPARLNTSRSPRGSGSPGSGDMAQVVVDLRHNDAGDPRDRQLAKCRQDEASDVAPILPGRAGLEPEGDVLPVEPRLASLRTVIALRPASRSASGSLPLRAAAMKAMARLSACAQVSTALFPKLIR